MLRDLVSMGIALIMIPFLPKTRRCGECGNERRAWPGGMSNRAIGRTASRSINLSPLGSTFQHGVRFDGAVPGMRVLRVRCSSPDDPRVTCPADEDPPAPVPGIEPRVIRSGDS